MLIEDAEKQLNERVNQINKLVDRTRLRKCEMSRFLPLPAQALVLVSYFDIATRVAVEINEVDRGQAGERIQTQLVKNINDMVEALLSLKHNILHCEQPTPKENPDG